jgi:hypothetical protein
MISFAATSRQKQETSMNRHHLAPTIMRVLLIFSLLITFFISIEQSAAPPVAQAATSVSISAGDNHTCGLKSDGSLAAVAAIGGSGRADRLRRPGATVRLPAAADRRCEA